MIELCFTCLGYPPKAPIQLHYDNKAACDIIHNLIQHNYINYVEVDIFFVNEKFGVGRYILKLPIRFDRRIN